MPGWAAKLYKSKVGFYCIELTRGKLVMFSVAMRKKCWALVLSKVSTWVYKFDASVRLSELMEPLQCCLESLGIAVEAEAQVYRLDVSLAHSNGFINATILDAVTLEDSMPNEPDEASDPEILECAESDVVSCSSEDVESGDVEAVTGSEGSVSEDLPAERMGNPKGVFVCYSSEYASMSLYTSRNQLTMRLRGKFLPELGEGPGSKSLCPDAFGADHTVAELVLKAWLLYRIANPSTFIQQKALRQQWWLHLLQRLQRDVVRIRSSGSTGSLEADALINDWAPGVLRDGI